ncbi:primosomal protein N' [Candidatus Saccharibacteria bacterium]|nr:primosomal protein N' [Candidatus Saccharibacteria bacterium]
MFYEVVPEKLFNKTAGFLTYSSDLPLTPGQLVEIPLGKSKTVGMVYKKVAQPNFPTKSISSILYSTPLPKHLFKLVFWLNEYYLVPLPTALSLILPKGITKRRRNAKNVEKTEQTPKLPLIELNTYQKNALKTLQNGQEATKLLHGVTGSGKTNIYLEMAKNALKQQKSTILLVPEISLTSQLVRVFEETFGQKVILMHSKKTEAERHKIWEELLNSTNPSIIIGPRSALFAPVNNLGLIVIDECHESTYFQENTPKYSALRLASFIATTLKIDCIDGSATPLIQDYYLAKTRGSLVTLKEKAKTSAVAPNITITDFKDRASFSKNRYFSNQLLESIAHNLEHGNQTLIFHNRRGSAPLSVCEDCGEGLLCPHCFLPLTLHADSYELICHTCGFKQKVPKSCPKCGSIKILHKGFGTKLLESELKRLFKNANIMRFDADNTKDSSLDVMYGAVHSGDVDIIIGTQTVAKGLDLPKLATVGVVQADAGLFLPDYSAEERTFELITQVVGRVGRGHLDTAEVFIQTFQPEAPVIDFAIKNDYESFADYLLEKRKNTYFPPFSYIAKIEITLKTERIAVSKIRAIYQKLAKNPALKVSSPTPAFHEHSNRGYTWQIVVRSSSRTKLVAAIAEFTDAHVTLDPPSLL